MSSREQGYQWTAVSGGVGTAVITDRHAKLYGVVIPGTYVGTINLHDAASTTGTTTTSQVVSFGLPATSIPQFVEVNANLKHGLVYQATGTPVVTILWD